MVILPALKLLSDHMRRCRRRLVSEDRGVAPKSEGVWWVFRWPKERLNVVNRGEYSMPIPANISSSVGPWSWNCGIPARLAPVPSVSLWLSPSSGVIPTGWVALRGVEADMVGELAGWFGFFFLFLSSFCLEGRGLGLG